MRRLSWFAIVLLSSSSANAGRSFYGWLQDSQVMPERGAEIGTFVSEENYLSQLDNLRDTTWWIAPSIGITDQLELTLPVQFAWDRSDHTNPRSNFTEYGVDLKYRMVTAEPVDKPELVPAVRARVERIVIGPRDRWDARVDLIATYESGLFAAAVNVGAQGIIGPDSQYYQLVPGAGVSIDTTVSDLRVGAE
ncbi:MAG TPA: hypothetical protein VGC41_05550, partial [Kofleriaceae bacterium]